MATEQYSQVDRFIYIMFMGPSTMTELIKVVMESVLTCCYAIFKEGTCFSDSIFNHKPAGGLYVLYRTDAPIQMYRL